MKGLFACFGNRLSPSSPWYSSQAVACSWWTYVKSLGYLVGALFVLWGLLAIANHFKLTGEGFHLPTWLDAIADTDPATGNPGAKADRIAMAIVVAGFLLFLGQLLSRFVNPF